MGKSFYQLLFLLWAFTHTCTSSVTTGLALSSAHPMVESPRWTAGEGTHLPQITESERNLPSNTTLPTTGPGSTRPQQPGTQSAQEGQRTRRVTATPEFPTRLRVATSAGRMSTGALLGQVTTWSLKRNPSSPQKGKVYHESTQSRLAQTVLGESNRTSLNIPNHNHTTSSTLAVQLTTAKPALTTAQFMPKPITPTAPALSQYVPATAKPASTRRPGDPLRTIAFSSSTKHTAKTGTILVTTFISKTTHDITPSPSSTTNTASTSTISAMPSMASATIPISTDSLAPNPNPQGISKPPVPTKAGTGTGSGGGSGAGAVVAGLVGGALLLMLGGIGFIMVRRRHFGQRQINDGTWAGPSPFLDGSAAVGGQPRLMADEDGEDRPQDSKRISLMGFFPRGFSRRLSHPKEVDEQVLMTDVTIGSTFGRAQETEHGSTNGKPPDQNQGSTQSHNQEPKKDQENNQDQNQGSTQSHNQEPNKDQENNQDQNQRSTQSHNQEPNKDQENHQDQNKDQEQNEKQLQTQDDTTINTSASPPAESSAPLPALLEDTSQDPSPSEAEATPPPPQLDENHLVSFPIPPALVLQEVDLGPLVSETDITPPSPSKICFVPPPPPPLPSST